MIKRNMEEYVEDLEDQQFVKDLVNGVVLHIQEVDDVITKYAPEWPINQITIVDRNILRIGVYELLFAESIPSKVAINEAIEIAKTFGGESSGRFVNGVLGALYRERTAAGLVKSIDTENKKEVV